MIKKQKMNQKIKKDSIVCRKVKFSDENSALFTIKKIEENSTIKKKPNRAYLCEKCNCWHLTSRPDIYVIQNENKELKKKTEELIKTIEELSTLNKQINSKEDKETRFKVKKDEQIKQLKHTNSILTKKMSNIYKDKNDLINRLCVATSTLEQCFLPNNLECDGAICQGCWKDLVNKAIKKLKNEK
jgi:predicted RNase H-like nuclease (RuvC/YqgF family)